MSEPRKAAIRLLVHHLSLGCAVMMDPPNILVLVFLALYVALLQPCGIWVRRHCPHVEERSTFTPSAHFLQVVVCARLNPRCIYDPRAPAP